MHENLEELRQINATLGEENMRLKATVKELADALLHTAEYVKGVPTWFGLAQDSLDSLIIH